ncbi:hypothetical protein HaLaN_04856, partial [Haematococcus lacustris]
PPAGFEPAPEPHGAAPTLQLGVWPEARLPSPALQAHNVTPTTPGRAVLNGGIQGCYEARAYLDLIEPPAAQQQQPPTPDGTASAQVLQGPTQDTLPDQLAQQLGQQQGQQGAGRHTTTPGACWRTLTWQCLAQPATPAPVGARLLRLHRQGDPALLCPGGRQQGCGGAHDDEAAAQPVPWGERQQAVEGGGGRGVERQPQQPGGSAGSNAALAA